LGGKLRNQADANNETVYDLAVVGGGVNGCGIARDAVGRGWSVFLCEKGDLASATSSAATKLIHGGLRYLEYYEFRLVREALLERETLWRIAPHVIWPLRFILPYNKAMRPAWLLRLGLFLYDHIGGRVALPPTRTVRLGTDSEEPLKASFTFGFEYSDCWVDDSRFVVLNARDAANRGAVIAPRTRCTKGERRDDLWLLTLQDEISGATRTVKARALVNAAGPWVADFLAGALGVNATAGVRHVKGSHIVVPKLYSHDRCYFFQNPDRRIFFAIPYERDFTLIGTTDLDYEGDLGQVSASEEEIAYLCAAASDYFKSPIKRESVCWSYSGVRPLYDDGASEAQAATRDYVLKLDAPHGVAPLLSVYGGKITTFRRLAEAALAELGPHLPKRDGLQAGWTAQAALPGGAFDKNGFKDLVASTRLRFPFLSENTAHRLVRAYGVLVPEILGDAKSAAQLGRIFGHDLSEAEIRHLVRREWAMTAADVLWRRSKLGLRLSAAEAKEVEAYLQQYLPSLRAAE
jgi:glycerol-3-phosphate dehydrogenase